MAAATHIPTKLLLAQGELSATAGINFHDSTSGNWQAMVVVAGSGLPGLSSSGAQFVSDITGSNAEISYSGYARVALTGVTWTADATLGQIDWSFTTFTFPAEAADPGTGRYIVIYWKGVGSGDSSYPVAQVIDPGGVFSTATASYSVAAPAGGLMQMTGGG